MIISGNIYKIIDPTLSMEDSLFSNISVYPNPTKDNININFGSNINTNVLTQIAIYDLHGKKVKSIKRTAEHIQNINTSQLSNGIYILQINNSNGEQSIHKLVIH